ncbi:MAG: hypothetical protein AAB456_00695 [Patescibacteria group bacterium]
MNINFKRFGLKVEKIKSSSDFNNEKFWPIFLMSLALFLMVSFGPQLINFVKALTSGVTLTATVGSTLTFTMDAAAKALGTITSGTPVQATSTLYIITNNGTGSNTTINRASTTATLFFGGQTITDTPNGNNWTAPAATTTAGPSVAWTTGTTVGLGFRAMTGIAGGASTTCGQSTTWWGTDDGGANAKWSGISTSTAAQQIANCNSFFGGGQGQTVIYKLDVGSTQAGGSYQSSPITFTVVVNP